MNADVEQKLWRKVYKYLPFLQCVPFLKMAAVCNSLPLKTANEKSDIDLFIIAEKNRLFTMRFFTTFVLHALGVRRHGNKIAGRFCLSFFVDETFLNLEKIAIENDVYLAHWTGSLIPVIDDGIYGKFIAANRWIDGYCGKRGMFETRVLNVPKFSGFVKSVFERILNGHFGNFVEFFMKKWQMGRAKKKIEKADSEASLIVDEHILKFHNTDRRKMFRDRWIDEYESAKIVRV